MSMRYVLENGSYYQINESNINIGCFRPDFYTAEGKHIRALSINQAYPTVAQAVKATEKRCERDGRNGMWIARFDVESE